MDFLWRSVNEEEKEKIKKEAKAILDNFSKALAKVEKQKTKDVFVERKKQTRKEKKAVCDPSFRELFFKNAPEKEGDWIKAEKGAWK